MVRDAAACRPDQTLLDRRIEACRGAGSGLAGHAEVAIELRQRRGLAYHAHPVRLGRFGRLAESDLVESDRASQRRGVAVAGRFGQPGGGAIGRLSLVGPVS